MRVGLIVLVLLVGGGLAYIRLAPSDPGRWHIDPIAAPPPGATGWKLAPNGGDAAAPVWAVRPEALLEALDAIALFTPRTSRLAGSPATGRVTYVTRSRIMGFPDYTTVQAIPAEGGSTLVAVARLRFGQSDLGVNRARLEDWVAQLSARLDQSTKG